MKNFLPVIFFALTSSAHALSPNPGLTAVFNSKKNNVSIKWQHTDDKVIMYVLQKSGDNNSWSDIYRMEASNVSLNKMVKYTDSSPSAGRNNYRLKTVSTGGNSYSASILVIIGKPGNSWIMYPVPVSTVLNLQYNGSELIPGVISVFIRTMRGQVLNRLRLASTTRLISIPLDNLGRGIYDIQIFIQNETVFSQRFVK